MLSPGSLCVNIDTPRGWPNASSSAAQSAVVSIEENARHGRSIRLLERPNPQLLNHNIVIHIVFCRIAKAGWVELAGRLE